MKLKKGDKVAVIAGKAKGQEGTIARAYPREQMVLIEGVNLAKRHRRPSAQNRHGQVVEIAMPIHASNVMLLDPKTGKPTRVRISREGGSRSRVAAKSGQAIK